MAFLVFVVVCLNALRMSTACDYQAIEDTGSFNHTVMNRIQQWRIQRGLNGFGRTPLLDKIISFFIENFQEKNLVKLTNNQVNLTNLNEPPSIILNP